MNLVGPGSLDDHYTDAYAALSLIETPVGNWVDLGTGAGFPGIVLGALHPLLHLDLVDSRSKRCAFIERVLATSPEKRPHLRVCCTRLENLDPHQYDGIIARALAGPATMLTHARRLLRPHGQVLILLQADGVVPDAIDFSIVAEHRYTVRDKGRRAVLLRWTGAPDDA